MIRVFEIAILISLCVRTACYIHFVVNSYLSVLEKECGTTIEWICHILDIVHILEQTEWGIC